MFDRHVQPFRWRDMTLREQFVWVTSYSLRNLDPESRLRAADNAVERLRSLNLDENRPLDLAGLAARAAYSISRSDFDVWFRISNLIINSRVPGYAPPTAEECAQAFEGYDRGRSDFW